MADREQFRTYVLYYGAFLAAIVGAWVFIEPQAYEYTALEVVDREVGEAPWFIAGLYLRFAFFFTVLIVVPGVALRLLLDRFLSPGAFSDDPPAPVPTDSTFVLTSFVLGLLLFVTANYLLYSLRLPVLYYAVVASSLMVLVRSRRRLTSGARLSGHGIVSAVLMAGLTALLLREYLYLRIFDIDEYYRAHFVLSWYEFRPFDNLLYYNGLELRSYTLLEFFSAALGRLSGLAPLDVYFFAFPFFIIVGTLGLLIWIIKNASPEYQGQWVYLIVPLLFVLLLSFDSYVLLMTTIRQMINGLFLILLSSCLYLIYRKRASRLPAYLIFALAFILTFGAKPLPALIAIAAFGIVELFNPAVSLGGRLARVGGLVLGAFAFFKLFVSFSGVEIRLVLDPLHNVMLYNVSAITPVLTRIAEHSHTIKYYSLLVTGLYYLVVYNVQILTVFAALYFSLAYFMRVQMRRPINPIIPLLFLMFGANLFCALMLRFQSSVPLGGPENYWRVYSLYFISTITILYVFSGYTLLRRIRPVLFACIIPLSLFYQQFMHVKDAGFSYFDDPDLINISKYIGEHSSDTTVVVHNFYEDRKSVYVPLFSRKQIYISLTEYGGPRGQPGLQTRIDMLEAWLEHAVRQGEPTPFPEPIDDALLLYDTSDATIEFDDARVVKRLGNYVLIRI